MNRKWINPGKNKTTQLRCLGLAAAAGVGLLFLPVSGSAIVSGPCVECHTMHNSQDNLVMAFDGTSGPYEKLLRGGCIACHTSPTGVANDGTNYIPYVNSIDIPTYGATGNTLAGGNFYWVAAAGGNDHPKGHNVQFEGLAEQDGVLANTPPGNDGTFTGPLTCAGVTGCHGDRVALDDYTAVSGAHHADDAIIDGNSVATSYRFLLGVLGLEDADWEYQPTVSTHNQYKGVDRTADSEDVTSTISSLCAQCHNDFHNGTDNPVQGANGGFGDPWIRHPTDFDMGNTEATSEYRNYGGTTTNAYVLDAPVASADVNSVLSTVAFADDTIVTCISCHRAHGTPYDDLLRWDYDQDTTTIRAGGAGSGGCLECHTTK
ncbi:MAG: cytochrome c3 family protein [Desulfobulbaceae bacterium]|nr:cytochrome c3 family protein [Desulfobulbaceae bacterium]